MTLGDPHRQARAVASGRRAYRGIPGRCKVSRPQVPYCRSGRAPCAVSRPSQEWPWPPWACMTVTLLTPPAATPIREKRLVVREQALAVSNLYG
jgi:hypothetical protein